MAAKVRVAPGKRGAHQSIGSALRSVAGRRGSCVVEVAPGRYPESLFVQGKVRITARRPGTVEICPPTGAGVAASGDVRLEGLVLRAQDNDVVRCAAGTLAISACTLVAHGDTAALHGPPGSSVTVTDTELRYGRAVFTSSHALIERCVFTDSPNNGLWAAAGADVTVRHSRFDRCRIHGLLSRGSRVSVTGCQFTGTGNASVAADQNGRLDVADCRIEAAQTTGILYSQRARGTITGTHVEPTDTGLLVTDGADPLVRGCTFEHPRVAGIEVNTHGIGRFENVTVRQARKFGMFVATQGAPVLAGCRFTGGKVGIYVENARLVAADTVVEGLDNAAVRFAGQGNSELTRLHVARSPVAVEAKGTTDVHVTEAHVRDVDLVGLIGHENSSIRAANCSVSGGKIAFSANNSTHVDLHDCQASGVELSGAGVLGTATLTARRLTVSGPASMGVFVAEKANLNLADSLFTGTTTGGLNLHGASALVRNVDVTGSEGYAVHHNGSAVLEELRSPLRVIEVEPKPEPPPVVHNYHGPVIHGDVVQSVLTWGNTIVQQATPDHRI
ncbi:right-handed parallel beta-helix repeat-containing protein [Amycolatopsis echigonensis]|uniref:Right-handed parallel beta-helix repeat-containing protein n=1 Tax=Amycolatopsis echigonensis TaxID=2576905 RepID=A0A8E2AZ83_9PSEU|nr:right-handed parallel beta-helix repeat-containing protein [Amycolatopsis echigonensis]MBB2498689.1 right-handed parallel beta-helix repeat-containing protein [Amycolatopsis echigonensis]